MKLICCLNLCVVAVPLAWGAEIDFVHDVAPVLKKHCVECHGGDESEGGFSMSLQLSCIIESYPRVPGLLRETELVLTLPAVSITK